jgi:lipopolysaccharide/colanic/teichoic acid biosynthesis glycosyltransferase
LKGSTAPVAKRLFDWVLACAGLLLLAPVMLGLALWIKLDSPGPVFFRQTRVGQHGRLFRIHKFRSMQAQAHAQTLDSAASGAQAALGAEESGGLLLTVGDDSRITRAGRFLRRTRLDELPQLIDVLQGRMSLVGPRPEVPRYVAHYPAALRARALAVRPGITDPVSLDYLDEAQLLAQAADPEHEYITHILPIKLQRAADYAEHASLSTDLRVIWRTLRVLWGGSGGRG